MNPPPSIEPKHASNEENKSFTIIPNAVLRDPNIKPTDKTVYGVLRSHMSYRTWTCFPSIETIAREAGCSSPTVQESLKRLERHNLIRLISKRGSRGRFGSNTYAIIKAGSDHHHRYGELSIAS